METTGLKQPVHLGHGFSARWVWTKGTDRQRGIPTGAIIAHGSCPPMVLAWVGDDPEALWDLVSLDPLSVLPAVRCPRCHREGQIVDGRWLES